MTASPLPFCEPFDMCGAAKTMCVKTSEDPEDQHDQTLPGVEAALASGGLEVWPLPQCD